MTILILQTSRSSKTACSPKLCRHRGYISVSSVAKPPTFALMKGEKNINEIQEYF